MSTQGSSAVIQPPAPSIGGVQESQGPGALRGTGGTDMPGYNMDNNKKGPALLMSRFNYKVPAGDRGYVLSRNVFYFQANDTTLTVSSGASKVGTVQVQSNDRVLDPLDSYLYSEISIEPVSAPSTWANMRYWPIVHLAGTKQFLQGALNVDHDITLSHDNTGPYWVQSSATGYTTSGIPYHVMNDGKSIGVATDPASALNGTAASGLNMNIVNNATALDPATPIAAATAVAYRSQTGECMPLAVGIAAVAGAAVALTEIAWYPLTGQALRATCSSALGGANTTNFVISGATFWAPFQSGKPYASTVPYMPVPLYESQSFTSGVKKPSAGLVCTEGCLVASQKTREWMRINSRGSWENLINRLRLTTWNGQAIEDIDGYNLLARCTRDATDRQLSGDSERQALGRGMTLYDFLEAASIVRKNKLAPGYAIVPPAWTAAYNDTSTSRAEITAGATSDTYAGTLEAADPWSRINIWARMSSTTSNLSSNKGTSIDRYESTTRFPYLNSGSQEFIEVMITFDFSGILGNAKYIPLKYLRALNIEVTWEDPRVVFQAYKDAMWAYMKLVQPTSAGTEVTVQTISPNTLLQTGGSAWPSGTTVATCRPLIQQRVGNNNYLADIGKAFRWDGDNYQIKYTLQNTRYVATMVELSNLMKNVLDTAANTTNAIPYTYTTWFRQYQNITSAAQSIICSKQCTHALMAFATFRQQTAIAAQSEDAFATNGFCLASYQWRQGNDYYPIQKVTRHIQMYNEMRKAWVVRGDMSKPGLPFRQYRNDIQMDNDSTYGANATPPTVRRSARDGFFQIGVSLQTSPGVEGSGINNGGGVNLTLDLVFDDLNGTSFQVGTADIQCDLFLCYNRVMKIAGDGTILIQE